MILDETKEPMLISGIGTQREEYLVLCCDPANRRPVVMAKSNPIAEAPIPADRWNFTENPGFFLACLCDQADFAAVASALGFSSEASVFINSFLLLSSGVEAAARKIACDGSAIWTPVDSICSMMLMRSPS